MTSVALDRRLSRYDSASAFALVDHQTDEAFTHPVRFAPASERRRSVVGCGKRGSELSPMNTLFLLMAQYEARVIIPAETVCKDYFSHLSYGKFLRKLASQEIDLPLTYAERSQKSFKGVHLKDLADYLDRRRDIALAEAKAFR